MTFFSKSMQALILGGSLLMGTTLANASAATAKPQRVGPVQNYGVLGTNGNKIISLSTNKEVMLRGMSMFWSDATGLQYYNENVMNWAATTLHVDVIRYAMGVQYYNSNGNASEEMDANYSYIGNPDKQLSVIDQMVEAAIKNDIYLIIDWHSHRADSEQTQAEAFFTAMATKYKDVPNIIWEVYNEPVKASASAIASYANSVIADIRNAGSKNLALVGTPNWSQMGSGSCGTVNQSNVGYVFHFYAGTHSKSSYSGNVDNCRNGGNAVFITEWGTTTADGKTFSGTGPSIEWETYMENNHISNCNWSIRNETSTIGEATTENSAIFSGSEFINTKTKLANASYTSSGTHIKEYLTSHASSWIDTLMATSTGSCAIKVQVTQSAGTLANVFKSGCTYTSSDPTVVTNDGTILAPGLAILTGSDGSKSVAEISEEPEQTYAGDQDVTCFLGSSCTRSKAIKDMDGDGNLEVIIAGNDSTTEGAKVTITSLNPEILTIKSALCTSTFCYSAKNYTVPMYQFTGTLGEAKVVLTAPAVSGYNALNDTVTITYAKGEDKISGKVWKDTTIAKGGTIAGFFATTTYYGKQTITYTFDNGQTTSPYLSNVDGNLVAGTEDAIVTVTATAPESDTRLAFSSTVTVIIGDSLTAAAKGNIAIQAHRAAKTFSAQFSKGGINLTAATSGMATVEIFSAMGKAIKSIKANVTAGDNWIPVSNLRAGHYVVRLTQDANVQLYTFEKK